MIFTKVGIIIAFSVIFAIGLYAVPDAFAATYTVENAQGSSSPGCEPDCFIPATLTISPGDMVTFANNDSAAHTSTSGNPGNPDGVWDSSLVMVGMSYTTPALEAGEYPYACMVHPWMIGLIIVEEGAVPTPAPTEPESEPESEPTTSSSNTDENAQGSSSPGCEPDCFIPATLTISPGDMVTFANNDSAAHTSTSGNPGNPDGVWDSSLVMVGMSYTTPALEAGEYPYFCMVHPWMTGLIIVGDVVANVADTVPPQVLVPDDIVIETDNQNGASATFNPQAIDNVDEILSPTCNFSSGSIFPIGTTEVICTATDSSGNSSSNSFNVTIEFSGILIPEWIKNVAGFWNAGDINDASFLEAIEYLIQNDIIVVPSSDSSAESSGTIPAWVKNTAGWWATDQIDDESFVNAIQFLIQAGLIQV